MYERFSSSLIKLENSQVHISGTSYSRQKSVASQVHLHTLGPRPMTMLTRLRYHFQTFQIWKSIRPDLIIITTPELLLLGTAYKFIFRKKLIYDVQENYLKNITFQRIYTGLKAVVFKGLIWIMEGIASRICDHFFLAESCYKHELTFIKSKYLVLENKTYPLDIERDPDDTFTILFSGTISDYTGIDRAIRFYRELQKFRDCQLIVAGFSTSRIWVDRLKKEFGHGEPVSFIGIDEFIEHSEIIQAISKAHLGIICHKYSQLNENRIPSKLYEYSFYDLPFIVQAGTNWEMIGQRIGRPVAVNFEDPDIEKFLDVFEKVTEMKSHTGKTEASWRSEEEKLLSFIKSLLHIS